MQKKKFSIEFQKFLKKKNLHTIDQEIIQFVRSHKCLYSKSQGTQNRALKDSLWQLLGEKMNIREDFLRRRWGNLRDRFFRVRREDPAFLNYGLDYSMQKTYKYYNTLLFLIENDTQSNSNNSNEEETDDGTEKSCYEEDAFDVAKATFDQYGIGELCNQSMEVDQSKLPEESQSNDSAYQKEDIKCFQIIESDDDSQFFDFSCMNGGGGTQQNGEYNAESSQNAEDLNATQQQQLDSTTTPSRISTPAPPIPTDNTNTKEAPHTSAFRTFLESIAQTVESSNLPVSSTMQLQIKILQALQDEIIASQQQ